MYVENALPCPFCGQEVNIEGHRSYNSSLEITCCSLFSRFKSDYCDTLGIDNNRPFNIEVEDKILTLFIVDWNKRG